MTKVSKGGRELRPPHPSPVVFRAAVARRPVVPVANGCVLDPVEVVANGAPVRVIAEVRPKVVPTTQMDDREFAVPFVKRVRRPHLVSLRAEDGRREGDWSVHPMSIPEIEQCATDALRKVVTHLRYVLREPRLDVRLGSLEVADWGMSGWGGNAQLLPGPVRPPIFDLLSPAPTVTADVWDAVARGARENSRLPLEREWLLEAMAFLYDLNFAMSVIAAAIACEIAAAKLVEEAMTAEGRITPGQARDFADEVSKRKMPLFLKYLDAVTPELAVEVTGLCWLSEGLRSSPLAFRTVREAFTSHGSSIDGRYHQYLLMSRWPVRGSK